jgi:hypothetical protein
MATPTQPQETYYTFAAVKGSTWRTAVPVGATHGIPVESDGSPKAEREYVPYEEMDHVFPTGGALLDYKPVEFSPSGIMRYDPGQLGTMLAKLMGTAGTPATVTTGVYLHTLQMADVTDGGFMTVISEYPGVIHEIASAKPVGISLTIANGLLKWTFKLRGNKMIDNSSVNTYTQVDAVTYVDWDHRVKFSDLVVMLNGQGGAGLAAPTDVIAGVNGITIDIDRKLGSIMTAGNDTIDEPKGEGQPEVKVKLSFARNSSVDSAFLAAFSAGTTYKMSAVFTGDIISTTYHYYLSFIFPRLVLSPVMEKKKGKVITSEVHFIAQAVASAPSGMTLLRPNILLQNIQATDYLA